MYRYHCKNVKITEILQEYNVSLSTQFHMCFNVLLSVSLQLFVKFSEKWKIVYYNTNVWIQECKKMNQNHDSSY